MEVETGIPERISFDEVLFLDFRQNVETGTGEFICS
jgi:hypothetical protein